MASEKTYPASPKKRKEAREKGQVAKSTEMTAIMTLFGSLLFIYLNKNKMFNLMDDLLHLTFKNMDRDITVNVLVEYIQVILKYLLPLLIIIVITAFMGNYVQIGLKLSLKAVKPDMGKINPLSGLKKMFSKDSFVELAKSLVKVIVVLYIAYSSIHDVIQQINNTYTENLRYQLTYVFDNLFDIILKIGMFLAILSVIDLIYKRFSFEKELKMTREEMMEEYKQDEGNPQMKQKQKEMGRMFAKKQIKKVKEATVVITNPTHFAVAIKYDPVKYPVPTLLFKGVDDIAQEAKKIARENNIPIVENKPLARAIYAQVKEDEIIPQELFQAVAVVIAYVYNMNNQNPNEIKH